LNIQFDIRHRAFEIRPSLSLPPIIERELRLAARRARTYWDRVGAAAAGAVLFLTVMNGQLASTHPATAGQFTFTVLASAGALLMVFTVLQLAAGAFSREKREDTLGLLFLTPLRPAEVAAGKLLSTSLGAFYRFVAMIPMLALPMLAGGVSFWDFLWLVLGLVNLVFFTSTVGLYFSAQSWDERGAVMSSALTLFAICLAIPFLCAAVVGPFFLRTGSYIGGLSPLYPVVTASARSVEFGPYVWSMFLTQALGWIFFKATCRILPSCWQDRPVASGQLLRRDEPQPEPQKGWPYEPAEPTPAEEPETGPESEATNKRRRVRPRVRRQVNTMRRQQLLDLNPILWLAQRWRADASSAIILAALGLVAPVIIFVSGNFEMFLSPGTVLFVSYCVQVGFKTYAATQAALAFARERGEDTLELLLSTPVSVRQLVEGHLQGIFETLVRWGRPVFWGVNVWMLVAVVVEVSTHRGDPWLFVTLFVGLLILFIPDVRAVTLTALWQGVVAKKTDSAASSAQVLVLGLPWLLSVIVLTVLRPLFESRLSLSLAVLLVGFSLAIDACFIRRSKRRLREDLPLWARRRALGELEHYDNWRRLGRRLGRWWAGGNAK
jgi:hypothetical protein